MVSKNNVIAWITLLATAILSPFSSWANIDIAAESYILIDMETKTVIAAKNPDLQLPPASLTKIMASYVYFKNLAAGVISEDDLVTISRRAWGSNVAGSKMFLEIDSQVSVAELLHGVIVQSGNDASIALAEHIAGGEKPFADLMNQEASNLGLQNSHFSNSTGLPSKNHYTTARDLALTIHALIGEFPAHYPLFAIKEYTYNGIRQENRNTLLSQYAGADGVKTGYTEKAGYGLAASAVKKGRRLISVVMKTKSKSQRASASIKLLNYGFNQHQNITLFLQSEPRLLPVERGQAAAIKAVPTERGIFTVNRSGGAVVAKFTPTSEVIRAPIKKGEQLGVISVVQGDKILQQTVVVAAEDMIEKSTWELFVDDIKINYLGHRKDDRKMLSKW